MPRLSLYRPNKTADYEFLDRIIYEQFSVGGTDIFVHKYLGPQNPNEGEGTGDQPYYSNGVKETNIQDMLFLENRDRKYDADIYTMRGIYNVADNDFNLSQFGLFLSNDTLYMTIHINSSVKTLGRKIMPGDVIELPHLIDEYALNDYSVALKRFYVVEDVNRASEGFSQTWWPHLYRIKVKQIMDSQEYKDILDLPAGDDAGNTLRDVLSTFEVEMQINDAIVAQAESNSAKSGYDVNHFYTLATNNDGTVALITADQEVIDASASELTADQIAGKPDRFGYTGYLLGTQDAPNGAPYGMGLSFPVDSMVGDYFLRTDFSPKRLFKNDGTRWVRVTDDVRMTLSNLDNRLTQKGTFINNTGTNTIAGETVQERQSLSQALRPKADN
tara:strand:+ start:973 stop:2133 length:1161 start_codon:yes stop_codon:yes gene_type:complete